MATLYQHDASGLVALKKNKQKIRQFVFSRKVIQYIIHIIRGYAVSGM